MMPFRIRRKGSCLCSPQARGIARFLWTFVILALSLPRCGCNDLPDDSITSVASPNNFVIFEATNNEFSSRPGTPMKIQSDIPVSIHRYYGQKESWEADSTNDHSDGVILVSSNCDTSGTDVVPSVEVGNGEMGSTFINIKLGILEEDASDMPFLQSSSYNTVSYEYGCDINLDRARQQSKLPTRELNLGATACLTESECDDIRQQMGIAKFQVIENYSTKGCFAKNNGIAYWGSGGSVEDKSKPSLPGIQERIWCGGEVELPGDNDTEGPGEADVPDGVATYGPTACLTESQCDDVRQQMGIARFQVIANYSTKGCFSKNDGIVYWGSGGSVEDKSKPSLPGVQERIWCAGEVEFPGDNDNNALGDADVPDGVATYGPTACLTESQCDDVRQQMGIARFQVIANYSTKGCFSKNDGIVYWGSGGSVEDNSKTSLPGIQERIWCEGEVYENDTNGLEDVDRPPCKPEDGNVCTTKDACDQMRLEMGIDTFRVAYYPTKGCFTKNGIAYWGRGGSAEDIAKSDLTGVLTRIRCCESSATLPPIPQDEETSPIEEDKDTVPMEEDVAPPEENKVPLGDYVACLSKEECNDKRNELGIDKFYSGTFPTKGCFFKNGWAYWGIDGTVEENSKAKLPGIRERIWCNDSNPPTLALGEAKANTVDVPEETLNSGFSVKSFAFSSLLHSAFSLQTGVVPSQLRAGGTCTYHAEVLLSGCQDGTPTFVEVAAPKARVINSVIEDVEAETYPVHESHTLQDGTHLCNKESKHTATLTFPDYHATVINFLGENFATVPLPEEDKCWEF